MQSDPILITGCARSGTSMVAGIIDKCGAFGGATSGPNRYNAKGMFENAAVRSTVVKPYLSWLGVDPMGQRPLPDIYTLRPLAGLRARVRIIIQGDGYVQGPWYYKGAKMCLIWPLWRRAFPASKWVIVRRADADIIGSCLKTGFMRAYKDAAGWQIWVDEHKKRFQEMQMAGMPIFEVWPDRFVKGDFDEAKAMVRWLGLEWNEKAVRNFIDPNLWRGK